MGVNPPSLQIMNRQINFFNNGLKSQNKFVKFFFQSVLLNRESLLYNNLKYFCRNLNCSLADLVAAKRGHIKKFTNKLLPEVEFWRVNLIKELINSSLIIELDNDMLFDILKFTCVE